MKKATFLAAAALIAVGAAARPLPAASANCLALDGQSYCRAWSAKNAVMSKTEFVRAGESVDRWQNMVTIIRYGSAPTLKDAVARYMSTVRRWMGPNDKPNWIEPTHPLHDREAATRLVLSTPDLSDSEYVVTYVTWDRNKPAYVVVFSQHIPLPYGDPTISMYGRWLRDMQAIPASQLAAH